MLNVRIGVIRQAIVLNTNFAGKFSLYIIFIFKKVCKLIIIKNSYGSYDYQYS